jgi:hypothetical protein
MATATGGSCGRQPPSSGKDNKDADYHAPSLSIPLSGNGKTLRTATCSSALFVTKGVQKTYVVDGLGLSPCFCRATFAEARIAAHMYTILDGDTYQLVAQLPTGPMANLTMPAAPSEAIQIAEISNRETVIATAIGPVSNQYNAAQVYRESWDS